MKLEYTDYFTSEYRYGTLYPKGIPYGTIIHDKLEKSEDWKLENRENNIEEKNDNRMDRNYGFSANYIYKDTNKSVLIHCYKSATGKTLTWTFDLKNIENQEEFKFLLVQELQLFNTYQDNTNKIKPF